MTPYNGARTTVRHCDVKCIILRRERLYHDAMPVDRYTAASLTHGQRDARRFACPVYTGDSLRLNVRRDGQAELTLVAGYMPRRYPISALTALALRRATSLIETSALPVCQTAIFILVNSTVITLTFYNSKHPVERDLRTGE